MDIASAAAIVNSINKLENKGKETVKVVVRCRPLFGKELVEGRQSIVTMDLEAAVVSIKCPDSDQLKSFTFDSVYDENTVQRQFYDESGYPLVESIFEGYNGTIFAYGQTGCGKTHTMQGKDNPPELRGVIPHAFDHVFDNINADTEREYMVRATYLEIYNEDIRDLLSEDSNKQKLELKESADGGSNGTWVQESNYWSDTDGISICSDLLTVFNRMKDHHGHTPYSQLSSKLAKK
ncbi:unnamed protein product [Aphanomyces euteiches]